MSGLGPRVGGAHVDVSMKMDEKSISQVGKRIHSQLSSLSQSLAKVGDHNREVYRSIGKEGVVAWRAFSGSIIAGAPHVGSAISGIAGAATMLAGSLYSTVQSAYALGPVVTSLGLAGLTLSIGLNNFFAAVGETSDKGLQDLLKTMPKQMQDAVMATRALSQEMRAALFPKLFAGLSDGINSLRKTGVIQRGLGRMAESLNFLAKSVLNYANSKQGVSTLNKFFTNNAKIFKSLSRAAVPFLDGFLRLINALTPASLRLTGRITDMAKSFRGWTKEAGFGKRIDDMMKGAEKTAGLLFKTLGNLGSAIINIFNAVNPKTNTFLEMLVGVTQRFEDWTGSVKGQNSLAKWAQGAIDIFRQLGETLKSVFKVTSALADPRVIVQFLKTVGGAFDLIAKLPLAKIVDAFVKLSQVLEPVNSAIFAVVIASAAMNILIGSMIGQMGGLFSVLSKFIQFKILTNILKKTGGGAAGAGKAAEGAAKKTGILSRAWQFLVKIATRLWNAFGRVTGLFNKTNTAAAETASKMSRLGKVFKPVLSILGKFAKFAGFVGLAVWIGTLIAKSKDLQAKLGKTWDALKGVGKSLKDAFSEVTTALSPLAPTAKAVGKSVGPILDFADKLATFALGVVIDTITYALKSLANVIKGAGRIIGGFITVLEGLFTLDFGKVWDGLKKMFSGLGPLLKGAFGLFITFFAPAKLAKIGGLAIKGLLGGLGRAMPGVLSGIGNFLGLALKFFIDLAPKLLGLGGKALTSLGRAFITYAPKVLGAIGRLVGRILQWIGRLPARLPGLALKAVKGLGNAVVRGTPKILTAFGRIYVGAIQWIMKLPGRLASLGGEAISKLASAIGKGVGILKKKAGEIVDGIVKEIKALPGQMLHLGTDLLNAGKTLGGKILSGIGSGLGAIGDLAGRIAADLKAGINRVIGLPKDISISVLGKHIGFTIPGFAKGGVTPGGLVRVGEQGPELVNLPRGSRVHSNEESKKMMSRPNMNIVINNPIPERASDTMSRAANIGFLLGLS